MQNDPSRTDHTAGQVDWPAWANRTPPAERVGTNKFSVTLTKSINDVEKEMSRLNVDAWRLSTPAPHRKSDGRPYADASPDDPAAVLRWTRDGTDRCVCADQYTRLRDNIRALGLWVGEMRKQAERPVETANDAFAAAALPGDTGREDRGEALAVAPGSATVEDPHEALGVREDATEAVVEAAARERTKEAHPDQGGSRRELKRVREAKRELLDNE